MVAHIGCDHADSDLTSRIIFQHSCSDCHCDQTLLKCKIHIGDFCTLRDLHHFRKPRERS